MSMSTIRPLTAADIPLAVAWVIDQPLWRRYRLRFSPLCALMERALAQAHILLVADVADDRACGLAWCMPEGAFGRSAYLRLIGVREDRTGQGIGAALLGRTESLAARHCRDLFLLVSDFNVDAQRFYRRHGYEQVGAIPGYVLPDVTELLFHKRLPTAS